MPAAPAAAASGATPPSSSAAPSPSARELSRPPSRPASKEPAAVRPTFPAKAAASKLKGEVNPFELSFSNPSPPEFALASLHGDGRATPGGSDVKPSLPSIGHITTPLEENEAFTWPLNTPAISSLRSGSDDNGADGDPLAKVAAGLPTPASSALIQHALAFDPSNFVRTGLTPGTGMTPLTGGPASFPPPSPNTAAFLAMVQNATASAANQMGATGQTPSGADVPMMTPGTFNNVMSQLSQMENGLGGPASAGVGQSQQQQQRQQQPDYFSHRHDGQPTHVEQQLAASQRASGQQGAAGPSSHMPQRQQPPPPPQQAQQQQQPQQQLPPHGQQPYPHPHGQPPPPPMHAGMPLDPRYAQQSAQVASQAANGLFLLSQAHHEIAKREQTDGGPLPPPPPQQQQMAYGGQMSASPNLALRSAPSRERH